MAVSKPPAATPHSWKGLRNEQCCHFRRARRPRLLDKGLRLRARHRRDREQVLRLRTRRARVLDKNAGPAREMRLRIGRHRIPSLQGIARDGRRLRRRGSVRTAGPGISRRGSAASTWATPRRWRRWTTAANASAGPTKRRRRWSPRSRRSRKIPDGSRRATP